jgi:hypothetical protein
MEILEGDRMNTPLCHPDPDPNRGKDLITTLKAFFRWLTIT